jgi:hypothetical protein
MSKTAAEMPPQPFTAAPAAATTATAAEKNGRRTPGSNALIPFVEPMKLEERIRAVTVEKPFSAIVVKSKYDAGIAGFGRIPCFTSISLNLCHSITNVTNLFRSATLRRLVLSESSVTASGLVGLQLAPALKFVDLHGCAGIVDAASIVLRAAGR